MDCWTSTSIMNNDSIGLVILIISILLTETSLDGLMTVAGAATAATDSNFNMEEHMEHIQFRNSHRFD